MARNDSPGAERLTALDAMFLDVENPGAHMHVGGMLIFDGPPPTEDALAAHVAARLDRVPRYRQRLAFVPFHLGRPVWVDDENFTVREHVRRVVLPPGSGEKALNARMARFLGTPLDRAKPLWEIELVEGFAADRFALLCKTHHCLFDGIGGVDFVVAVTDPEARPPATPPPAPWTPRPAPSPAELVAAALRDRVLAPLRLAREALADGTPGRRMVRELAAGAAPLAELAVSWAVPKWTLEGRSGPDRAWETATLALSDIKEVRAALGGTVNDVALAALGGALREVLIARGDPLPDEVRVFVPVNVRAPEARGTYGNQVALLFCPVPVAEPDPRTRLARVAAATARLKTRRQAVGILAFEHLGELTPAIVATEAIRAVLGLHFFNLIVSNIPGPTTPLYLLGRRMLACHPAIPFPKGQTFTVGLLSYAGTVAIGLLGDAGRAAELARLAAALPRALDALLDEARAVKPARAGRAQGEVR